MDFESQIVLMIIGLVVCMILTVVWLIKHNKAQSNISLINDNCILVSKADGMNIHFLTMKRHLRTAYKYNPASITYTGATVGGVTTGGFSYDKAHYTNNADGFTDKYELWFNDSSGKHLITDIKLSDSLISAAKGNITVAQFLKDDTLHLKHEGAQSRHHDAISWAVKNRDMDIYELTNLMLPELEAKMLNKNEMQAVFDFICGK